MMEDAGNDIADLTQNEIGARSDEIAQKIYIVNLSKCVIWLAKEIDKLAKLIKEVND